LVQIEALKLEVADVETVRGQHESLMLKIKNLKLKNQKYKELIETSKTSVKQSELESTQRIEFLENMHMSLSAEVEALKMEKETNAERLKSLHADLEALQKEKIADLERIKALQLSEGTLRMEKEADLKRIEALHLELSELERLRAAQVTKEANFDALKTKYKELEEKMTFKEEKYSSKNVESEKQLQEIKIQCISLSKEIEKMTLERATHNERIIALTSDIESFREEKEADNLLIKALQGQINALNGLSASGMWFEAHEQIEKRINFARQEMDEERKQAKVEVQDLIKQRNQAIEDCERYMNERDEWKTRLEEINRNYAKDEKEMRGLQKVLDSTERELDIYKDRVAMAQDEINRLKLQLQDQNDLQMVIEQPVNSPVTLTRQTSSGLKRSRSNTEIQNSVTKKRRIQVIRPNSNLSQTPKKPANMDGEKL